MAHPLFVPAFLFVASALGGCAPVDSGEGPVPAGDAGDAADAGSRPADDGSRTVDGGPSRATSYGFSVGTWNLEQFPLTSGTSERVAELVPALGFDLVGIQEITDRDRFEALAASIDGYDAVVSFESGFIRTGFLYRTDRVEVSNIDRMFTDDWWAFPRAPLRADIRVFDASGETVFDFVFVVLHLKAQIDEESRMRRSRAVELLAEWLDSELAGSAEQDYVIVGDFNDTLLDVGEQNVYGPLLGDPDRFRFLTQPAEEAGEYSYLPFRKMIDHVLVTTDALVEYGDGDTEVLLLDAEMPDYRTTISDHRPVVSRFAL